MICPSKKNLNLLKKYINCHRPFIKGVYRHGLEDVINPLIEKTTINSKLIYHFLILSILIKMTQKYQTPII